MILPFNIKVIYLYPYILKMYRHMHTFCRAIQVFCQVKKKQTAEKRVQNVYIVTQHWEDANKYHIYVYIYLC